MAGEHEEAMKKRCGMHENHERLAARGRHSRQRADERPDGDDPDRDDTEGDLRGR